MTATDELRRMLDERGVEYEKADGWWTSWETEGASYIGGVVYCEDLGAGLEIRWHIITPEQAIAATLGERSSTEQNGVGTCHMEHEFTGLVKAYEYMCDVCGEFAYTHLDEEPPNYCPNCGRRVKGDAE